MGHERTDRYVAEGEVILPQEWEDYERFRQIMRGPMVILTPVKKEQRRG